MDWRDLAREALGRNLTLPALEKEGWRQQQVWEMTLLLVRELTMRGLLPAHPAADEPGCYRAPGARDSTN